jgi:uncharacterized protein YneF (UPF0154 family)
LKGGVHLTNLQKELNNMNKTTSLIIIILLIIIAFIAGIFSSDYFIQPKYSTKFIIRDTVIKIKNEPVYIEKVKAKMYYKHDTIIQTKPFTATIDTVMKSDTVYARYDFPENLFALKINPKKDSLVIPQIVQQEVKSERLWWEIPVSILSGIAIGVIISK